MVNISFVLFFTIQSADIMANVLQMTRAFFVFKYDHFQ